MRLRMILRVSNFTLVKVDKMSLQAKGGQFLEYGLFIII
jgi:hypothetical protein